MAPALGGTFQDDGSHLAGNGMVPVLVSHRILPSGRAGGNRAKSQPFGNRRGACRKPLGGLSPPWPVAGGIGIQQVAGV